MPSRSKPTQYDIFGNEVAYQNLVKPTGAKKEVWYVHFVRGVRDWRKITNPDTGTVYEFVTQVPREKLDSLVSWGKAEKFDTREEAIARAKQMIGTGLTFSAGVWPTARREGQPSFLYSMTSRAEAEKTYSDLNATAVPNVKQESKQSRKNREQS